MTVKATAHSKPRGSLCSTSFQPSRVGSRILLADADDKQKVSTMSVVEKNEHVVTRNYVVSVGCPLELAI